MPSVASAARRPIIGPSDPDRNSVSESMTQMTRPRACFNARLRGYVVPRFRSRGITVMREEAGPAWPRTMSRVPSVDPLSTTRISKLSPSAPHRNAIESAHRPMYAPGVPGQRDKREIERRDGFAHVYPRPARTVRASAAPGKSALIARAFCRASFAFVLSPAFTYASPRW